MSATGSDASLQALWLTFPGHEPVAMSKRMRGFHAPLQVVHELDQATLRIEPADPHAAVELEGQPLGPGRTCQLRLQPGMNAYRGGITASDGKTTTTFDFRIVRALPAPSWQRVAETSPWPPRDSAGELVFNGRMWLLGGYIPSFARDVWSSSDGIQWTAEGEVPTPVGIDIPLMFVLHERMFVSDAKGVLYSSANGRDWSVAVANPPWGDRLSAGSAVFAGRAWIMGGRTREGQLLNDIWSSPDGTHWTREVEHAPWCGRMIHHTPLVLGGKLWLLGGGTNGSDYYPFVAWNDVWCSDNGRDWQQVLDHAPWPSRIWGATAVYRDRLWVLGGFRSEPTWENLGDVWYSHDGADWRPFQPAPPIAHSGQNNVSFQSGSAVWMRRHEHSAYTFNDALWVVGGMVWPLVNDVWRLHLPGLCFLSQPPLQTFADGCYEYQPRADFHRSCRPVRYELLTSPPWLVMDGQTGRLHGRPSTPGTYPVVLRATEPGGESAQQAFFVEVRLCR